MERELIESSLKGNYVFSELNPHQIENMVLAFERQRVKTGADLIVQGEEGDYFYVVETGTFDFVVHGAKVGQCGPCASFGELALLYDTKRAATVTCTSAATVFALNRETFKFTLSNQVQTYSDEVTEVSWRVVLKLSSRLLCRNRSSTSRAFHGDCASFSDRRRADTPARATVRRVPAAG